MFFFLHRPIVFLFFCLFFLFSSSPGFAQDFNKDSLLKVLRNARHDTTRISVYMTVVQNIYADETDSAFHLISICKTLINPLIKSAKDPKYKSVLQAKKAAILYDEAGINDLIGNSDISYQQYMEGIELYEKAGDWERYLVGYLSIGTHYQDLGKNDSALWFFNEALRLCKKHPSKKNEAKAYNNIGVHYFYMGELNKTVSYFLKSLKMREQLKDFPELFTGYNNLGFIYDQLNKPDSVLYYYNKALANARQRNDHEDIATTLNNISTFEFKRGNIESAIEDMQGAYDEYKKHGDNGGMIKALSNLGHIYNTQGDSVKAMKCYRESIQLARKYKNLPGLANSLNNYGIMLERMQDLDSALLCFLEARKIGEETGNSALLSRALMNIAIISDDRARHDEAIQLLDTALELTRQREDKEQEGIILRQIANNYVKKKDFANAMRFAKQSEAILKKLGYPESLKEISHLMYELHLRNGNYKEALASLELHIKMRDSIINQETRKATIRNSFKAEYAQKQLTDSLKGEAFKREMKKEQDRKDELAEKERQKQQTIIYAGLIVLILVLGFAIYIWNSFQQKKKANIIITEQKKEVELQKEIVEEKQKEILDSINYAKRIQYTLLSNQEMLDKYLKEHFVLFMPKDIVSGDFYWSTYRDNKFYFAVCDSTGHGVPGAFMSLLNISFLNEAINEKNISEPHLILNHVRKRLIENVSQEGAQDGMDGTLLCIDYAKKKITYSAAHNAPVVFNGGLLNELSSDKMPIGKGEREDSFRQFEINFKTGDSLYLFTDGYADQFGGPKGKKFKYTSLFTLLGEIQSESFTDQRSILKQKIESWKGGLEQIDDICVVGIRLNHFVE